MPNAKPRNGESPEEARLRYNAEMREYRRTRKSEGRPVTSSYSYDKNRRQVARKYGISHDEATEMLAAQGGCAICGEHVEWSSGTERKHQAVIDHCHTSGAVRGILCNSCNLGLGKFRDSPELLRKAAQYLLP